MNTIEGIKKEISKIEIDLCEHLHKADGHKVGSDRFTQEWIAAAECNSRLINLEAEIELIND